MGANSSHLAASRMEILGGGAVKIRIGEVFRVPGDRKLADDASGFRNLHRITRGRHDRGFDPQKGMFFFGRVHDPDQQERCPAFILYSTRRHRGSISNPWLDVIDEDRGYALYYGDNRRPDYAPSQSRGNRRLIDLIEQYSDPKLRNIAPPVLLFEDQSIEMRARGFRRFSGFGVPTNVRVQAQASPDGHFVNLAIELALFSTDAEDGFLDWSWIDDRRDGSISGAHANRSSPKSWRTWVLDGDAALDRVRRTVIRLRVTSPDDQRDLSADDFDVLSSVHEHYKSKPYQFEGLASLVAQRVLGSACTRGWVTRQSGDGGIDFVSRLAVGSDFSTASLVVLGQAKNLDPFNGTVAGRDLSRITARLQRGWLGIFVTTGAFSGPAQVECDVDKYPLVLVNGKRLAQEVRKELASTGLSLTDLFRREAEWYASNHSSLPAENILHDRRTGHELWRLES